MRQWTAERRPFPVVPLAPIACALVLGILVDRYSPSDISTPQWALASLAVLACGLVSESFGSGRLATVCLLAGLLAVGGAWHHARWTDLAADDLSRSVGDQPAIVWVKARVIDPPNFRPGRTEQEAGLTRVHIEVVAIRDEGDWRSASGGVMASIGGDHSNLLSGHFVELAGELSKFTPAMNPGELAYADYLRGQGIRLRLQVDDSDEIEPEIDEGSLGLELNPLGWIGRLRAWSLATLSRGLDQDTLPLAAALLLGRRELVDAETNQAFAMTGTTHLLAISGLHLQVLAATVGLCLLMVGVRRVPTWGAVAIVTIIYALLVGLAPSVVRSAAMTVTACLAEMRYRRKGMADVMAMAVIVTIALNPLSIFDVGGQLSFLAVGAILWNVAPVIRLFESLIPKFTMLRKKIGPFPTRLFAQFGASLWQGIVLSTIVWLVALPLVVSRFHIVSPIGVFLNIPLIPLTSAALLCAGATLLLTAIWPPLAIPTSWICGKLLYLTAVIVRWGADVSYGHAFEPGPPDSWVNLFYVGLGLATWTKSRTAFILLCGWSLVGIWLAVTPVAPSSFEAEVLAVEHGLAILHQSTDGHAFLYDCGKMQDPLVGRRIIAPALWSRRIRRLDAIILSHADADHFNGLPDLLDRFRVDRIILPPHFATETNPAAVELVKRIRDRGIPIVEMSRGSAWSWGGADLKILHPPAQWAGTYPDNARSFVLQIEINGHRAIWTGDLDGPGLIELMKQDAAKPDILLSPHHGGKTANPPWFYEHMEPSRIVVSRRPPAPNTVDTLAGPVFKAKPIDQTWEGGAITYRFETNSILTGTFLSQHLRKSDSR